MHTTGVLLVIGIEEEEAAAGDGARVDREAGAVRGFESYCQVDRAQVPLCRSQRALQP